MSNCSITLQTVVNFASTHADLLPLAGVGGYTDEPAISLCNDAISDLISDPNDWTFNRVEMPPMFTCANKQDYLFAGASAFTLSPSQGGTQTTASQGWAIDLATNNGITVSGGVVTVKTIEPHRLAVGDLVYMTGNTNLNYNSVFTDNGTNSQWTTSTWTLTGVTTNSFSFNATAGQANGDVTGAPGIVNFGYATSASMQEVNNNSSPPNQFPLTVKRELNVSSRVAIPEKVCVLADLGTGVLKIRLLWVPSSTIYAVNLVYQAKAPLKKSLTESWAPFPDQYAAVYRQALLYRMYRYLNDPKTDMEYKKLQGEIMKIQATDDSSLTDVSLVPEDPLMSNDWGGW